MDKKQITITKEDLDDILMNYHSEFTLVISNDFGWIIKQVVTNNFFEVKGYLDNDYDLSVMLLSTKAQQVFPIKKECIVYE